VPATLTEPESVRQERAALQVALGDVEGLTAEGQAPL
jgi:hypothetical protein